MTRHATPEYAPQFGIYSQGEQETVFFIIPHTIMSDTTKLKRPDDMPEEYWYIYRTN